MKARDVLARTNLACSTKSLRSGTDPSDSRCRLGVRDARTGSNEDGKSTEKGHGPSQNTPETRAPVPWVPCDLQKVLAGATKFGQAYIRQAQALSLIHI